MTTLHEKMLSAIDAYFSAANRDEEMEAEDLLLDVRDEIRKQPAQEPVAVMTVLHLKDRIEIGYGPKSAGYDLPTGEYPPLHPPPSA